MNSIVRGLTRRAITVMMPRSDVKLQRQQHADSQHRGRGYLKSLAGGWRMLAPVCTMCRMNLSQRCRHSPTSRPGKGARDRAFFGIVPGCSQQVFDMVQTALTSNFARCHHRESRTPWLSSHSKSNSAGPALTTVW